MASPAKHAPHSPRNPGIKDEARGIIVLYQVRSMSDEFVSELEKEFQMLGDGSAFGSAPVATEKHGEKYLAGEQKRGSCRKGYPLQ